MYDIIFVSDNKTHSEYRKLKEKFPFAKITNDLRTLRDISLTEFFWIVYDDLIIAEDFNFDYVPDEWSKEVVHVFKNKDAYDGIALVPRKSNVLERELKHRFYVSVKEVDIVASHPKPFELFTVNTYDDYISAFDNSTTEMFWIVPTNIDVLDSFKFDTYFTHHEFYDRKINHVYLNGKYHDGIVLCSKHSKFSKREFDYKFIANKKEVDVVASVPKPYDIVFISYQEPNADENFAKLKERFPRVQRVHGVKGIHQAHIEAAKLCNTDMIWIVDGDAIIVDDFNFDYQVALWDKEIVHVWRSQNPINNMVYGYGGVKLFPRELTLNMDVSKPDMTTSISSKFKAVKEVSNITAFNTDPFNTWKSAFRECTKLSSKVIDRQKDDETTERLTIWTTIGKDREFGEYAIAGALLGAAYGADNQGNIDALKKINDFDWLKEKFNGSI